MRDRSAANVNHFLARHQRDELSELEKVDALRLLEMQRHSLLMFAIGGWFFEKISRSVSNYSDSIIGEADPTATPLVPLWTPLPSPLIRGRPEEEGFHVRGTLNCSGSPLFKGGWGGSLDVLHRAR